MMRTLLTTSLFASFAALVAQAPADWQVLDHGHRLRTVAVSDCATAVVLAWPHPFRARAGEQRALAQAVACYHRDALAAQLPVGSSAGVEVLDGVTLFHALLPANAPPASAALLVDALLAPVDAATAADALLRAAARAALAADDAEALVPGPALASRARRELAFGSAVGCSIGGDPSYALGLTAAELAVAVAAPPGAPVTAVVVGSDACGAALAARLARLVVPAAVESAPRAAELPLAAAMTSRLDAPYVAVAMPTPPPTATALPFALAIEVLRARAQQQLRYRRNEVQGGAPLVAWSLLTGGPCLLFRRGVDGQPVERPRQELTALLADLRQLPINTFELAAATAALRIEWALPPWAPAQAAALRLNPAGLVPRARTLLLLDRVGLADAAVATLDRAELGAVQAALRTAVDAAALHWYSLEPPPPPPFGG